MGKVILILCDALRDDAAAQMGFLNGLVEARRASRYRVRAALPALSRPLYETIHTGLPPTEHGITSNLVARASDQPNIFQLAREAGRTTAAAAYCWYSELYVRAPFEMIFDREVDDETRLIQHGRFYREDDYPDIEVFLDAAMLMLRHMPDYLLVHPMGLDYIGHKHGGGSGPYLKQVALQDQIMANFIPQALGLDYTILVTGDHGMNEHGVHNGEDTRHVPLFIISPDHPGLGDTGQTVDQLRIAPTLCHFLDIPPAATMKYPAIVPG